MEAKYCKRRCILSRKSISQKDLKLLWGLAASKCSHPDCKADLILPETDQDCSETIGKMAHIFAHSRGGPRFNPNISEGEVNSYDNLILLCGTHHDIVDKRPNEYSADILFKWKKDHEKWVKESLSDAMPKVAFVELEKVVKGILARPSIATKDLTLTPPVEKIRKNQLSKRTHDKILIGMIKANEVKSFVREMSKLEPGFPEKIRNGFLEEYKLKNHGLSSDSLFEGIHDYASRGLITFEEKSAALAVIVYLFELCEIFEK